MHSICKFFFLLALPVLHAYAYGLCSGSYDSICNNGNIYDIVAHASHYNIMMMMMMNIQSPVPSPSGLIGHVIVLARI